MLLLGTLLYFLLLPFVVPLVLQNLKGSRPLVFLVAVGLFVISVLLVRLFTPAAKAHRIQENISRSWSTRFFCLGAFLLTLSLVLLALFHFRQVPDVYFWLYVLPALVAFGLNVVGIDLPRRSPRSPEPDEIEPEEPNKPEPEIVGDLMLMTYCWETRKGEQYRIDGFPIRRKVYEWTKRQPRVVEWEKWPLVYVSDAIEPELRDLARRLYSKGKTFGTYEEVDFVVQFIQGAIEYQHDPGHNNPFASDYPRYPIETLGDTAGDCEDVSILGAAMLVSMGYKAALLLMQNPCHAMLGVAAEGMAGTYCEVDGVRYYYCEMTTSGPVIGEESFPSARLERAIPIPLPAPKIVRPTEDVEGAV
jgi:hypothetical protein